MNEPLRKKAREIIEKRGGKSFWGNITFSSEEELLDSFIEFGKFYKKFEHESEEEKKMEGNDTTNTKCVVCKKDYFTECRCH
jgi:hypothetical protein